MMTFSQNPLCNKELVLGEVRRWEYCEEGGAAFVKVQRPSSSVRRRREETPSSGCNTVTLCGFRAVRPTEGSFRGESPWQQRTAESGMSFTAEKINQKKRERRVQDDTKIDEKKTHQQTQENSKPHEISVHPSN